ncbi:hypothetical protein EJB05_44212 [Eragrostis curvula]|uniref:Uncharacterized protein n=1 Tax=Eragrostis curvula TaxID=38414 RepID=A0A5J9TID3_9POAL|nr:hypothetical protein EJB05_44212 [Eragrostis curvula]
MKTPLLSPWTQCAEGGHQVLRQDALGFPYLGLFPGLAVLPAVGCLGEVLFTVRHSINEMR